MAARSMILFLLIQYRPNSTLAGMLETPDGVSGTLNVIPDFQLWLPNPLVNVERQLQQFSGHGL